MCAAEGVLWAGDCACLCATAAGVSGACCFAGSSVLSAEEGSQEPKWICVGCCGRVPQDICGEHTAENLLLHGVTLEHLCSLLPALGKCGYGLLDC